MRIHLFVWIVLLCTVVGADRAKAADGAPQREQTLLDMLDDLGGNPAGLYVHIGAPDGRLAASLGETGRFLVHALVAEKEGLEAARAHIRERGLYGQVSADHTALDRLPYANDLVNLAVVEDTADVPLPEVIRVLAAEGVGCFRGRRDADALAEAGFEDVRVSDAWTVAIKPRPEGMDDWTHRRYGPGGNAVSSDTVGVPDGLRWKTGPLYQTGRHYYGGSGPVVANGRLFNMVLEEALWLRTPTTDRILVARDASNGLLLWRRRAAPRRGDTLVAIGDRLWAKTERNGPIELIDAATGQTLETFDAARGPTCWVVLEDLLIARDDGRLLGLDAFSGEQRWEVVLTDRDLRHHRRALVASEGRVVAMVNDDDGNEQVVCLNAADGEEQWRADTTPWREDTGLALVFLKDGIVVFHQETRPEEGRRIHAHAISAADGRHLWSATHRRGSMRGSDTRRPLLIGGLVWLDQWGAGGHVGLSPTTGEVEKEHEHEVTSRRICTHNRATQRFILNRRMQFSDLEAGVNHLFLGARNACSEGGVLPAHNLIYTFPHQCICYPMMRGSMGLASGIGHSDREVDDDERLVPGPAYELELDGAVDDGDWPTYRRDARRTGGAVTPVPADAELLWQADLAGADDAEWPIEWQRRGGGRISAPVVAGGRIFLARPHEHKVVSLDAETGEQRWAYTVGGRVDTPPTIYRGLCLFGSTDGWVYALRADDGREVWRFLAAPDDLRIVAFGQLESTWPVAGSVLVQDGLVYFAAGRHSEVDGGVVVYALDPQSGKLVWKQRAESYQGRGGLLVSDGHSVGFAAGHFLARERRRTWAFDPKTGESEMQTEPKALVATEGLLAEMWTRTVYAASRMSTWTVGRASAEMLVFNREHAFGSFREGSSRAGKLAAMSLDDGDELWTVEIPESERGQRASLVTAMALTGEILWTAGRLGPEPGDYRLRAYSTRDGRLLREIELPEAPVYDGMAAARGRLYLSTTGGRLLCFGE